MAVKLNAKLHMYKHDRESDIVIDPLRHLIDIPAMYLVYLPVQVRDLNILKRVSENSTCFSQ